MNNGCPFFLLIEYKEDPESVQKKVLTVKATRMIN